MVSRTGLAFCIAVALVGRWAHASEEEGAPAVPASGTEPASPAVASAPPPGAAATSAPPISPPPDAPAQEPASTPAPEETREEAWDDLASYLDDALREYAAAGRDEGALGVPGAVSVLTYEQLRSRGATNIVEAMRGQPGLDVTMITASQPLVGIRGSNPFDTQRLAVLVDGTPTQLDFFGIKTFTQLPVALVDVDRVEVLRNPGTLYGANAISGAVNVVTRRPTQNEVNVRLSGGENVFRSASASAAAVGDKQFFRLSFETTRTNQFADVHALEGSGPDLKTASSKDAGRSKLRVDDHYTVAARGNKRIGAHTFDATTTLSSFEGYLRFPDRICEQNVHLKSVVASLGHEVLLGDDVLSRDQLRLNTRATFTQIRSDLAGARSIAAHQALPNGKPMPGASVHELTRDEWLINSQFSGPFLSSLEGQFISGVELQLTSTQNTRMLSRDFQRGTAGVYLLPSISPVKNLRLFAGGRADFAFNQRLLLSPTASAVYRAGDHSAIRVSLSSAARSPNMYELGLELPFVEDPSSGKRGYYFGNPELGAERLSQAEVGYKWESPRVKAGINGFYSVLNDQIEMVEIGQPRVDNRNLEASTRDALGASYDTKLPYLEYQNQADVQTLGSEVFGEVEALENLRLQGSVTVLRSEAKVKTDPELVVRRESAADRNAPTLKFSVGAHYRLTAGPLPGITLSAFYDWSDRTSAYVSGDLKTIPAWSVLTARVSVPLPRDLGDIALEGFNALGQPHFEWPRHQVGRRVLGTLTLKL